MLAAGVIFLFPFIYNIVVHIEMEIIWIKED